MARAIGYAAIAPTSTPATVAKRSFFAGGGGQKLKGSKISTPREKPGTPVAGVSSNTPPLVPPPTVVRRGEGPQPLRLPPGKLFFGYEIKPIKKGGEKQTGTKETLFGGAGKTLRGGSAGGKKRKGDEGAKGKGKNAKPDSIEID
jgi:ubiquitin fusion degradation protein 1